MRALWLPVVAGLLWSCAVAAEEADHFRSLARPAVQDVLQHFWIGDETSGQIVNTWHGYAGKLPDERGGLWERATLYVALENACRALGDPGLAARLRADWTRTKTVYTAKQLEACGQPSHTNWAADDAGWSALMYLAAYRATGDHDALDRARGLVSNAFDRWLDDDLGGGMWYRDDHHAKSLYQTALVLAALRIHELTGDSTFLESGRKCYDWMESHLLREDGLYWCDYGRDGPAGKTRPKDIHEAGSVSFLGGNMAMGVLHAHLFRSTGDDLYRRRALRTADSLLPLLVAPGGVYINDRDAWSDGMFAGDWAREVLSLPGIHPRHASVLKATAESICQNARTSDGFFGGSWSGPPDGEGSRWFVKNSKPQQLMTSANSLGMVVAAAVLEVPK